MLDDQQIQALTPEAREAYQTALELEDQVLWAEFTQQLERVADLDPEHIPLQFLAARQAINMARIGKGSSIQSGPNIIKSDEDLGHEYYDIAQKCMQRVLDTKNLPRDLFQRAENMMQTVKSERSDLPRRIARREEVAFRFLAEHVNEIYQEDKEAVRGPSGDLTTPQTEAELSAPPRSQQQQQLPPAQLSVNPFAQPPRGGQGAGRRGAYPRR